MAKNEKRKRNEIRYRVKVFSGTNWLGKEMYRTTHIRREDVEPKINELIEIGRDRYIVTFIKKPLVENYREYGFVPTIWAVPVEPVVYNG